MVAECAGGEVDLKGHGLIVDSVLDGHSMRITMEKPDGRNELSMVDICTGKVTGTLVIDSDPADNEK